MPRVGLSTEQVVKAASTLIDEIGLDKLTLALIAKQLNVQLPSLYKHIASLQDLRDQVVVEAQHELLEIMKEATVGRSGKQALLALADAAREWGLAHPGQYAITLAAPHTPGDGSEEMLEFTLRILEGFNLKDDNAIDAARVLRATLHGFISLESRGGFGLPTDVSRSFKRAIGSMSDQFAAWGSA